MKLLNTHNVWWGSTVSSSNLVAAFNECKLGNRQLLSHTLTRAHTHTHKTTVESVAFFFKENLYWFQVTSTITITIIIIIIISNLLYFILDSIQPISL